MAQLARRLGVVAVGSAADQLRAATSTRVHVLPPPVVQARVGAAVTVEGADPPPALFAILKHAASMPNPAFYERQRRRVSTWQVPRFLHSYDEKVDGSLMLLRGLLERAESLVRQAGSRLEVTDERQAARLRRYVAPRRSGRLSRSLTMPSPSMTWACSWRRREPARPSSPAP